MVDFRKLMTRTPEERRADLDRATRDYEEREDRKLATRLEQVKAALGLANLNDRETSFLRSLQFKTTRPDNICGRMGGELLYLSDPQVKWLQDLAKRAAAGDDSSAAKPPDLFSRMNALSGAPRVARPVNPAPACCSCQGFYQPADCPTHGRVQTLGDRDESATAPTPRN